MEALHPVTEEISSMEEAIELANEINRLDSAVKKMKKNLKAYVEAYGEVKTDQETWNFYESVSWTFEKDGLKEIARSMKLEQIDPWDYMTVSKPTLNKLGYDDDFLQEVGTKKVTQRFTSRKNKNS